MVLIINQICAVQNWCRSRSLKTDGGNATSMRVLHRIHVIRDGAGVCEVQMAALLQQEPTSARIN
ncbi:hypothetical protein TSUD_13750 [Trifolium subterraneum]|uniref:Uncharacterized protein n=1 Tax=Trifolium subterraneum TaxID=3900 RepID=A0A2Z6NHU2_TRISU|nr:hypothetical protein TSUD_13750 [Trifolium subterraneum]